MALQPSGSEGSALALQSFREIVSGSLEILMCYNPTVVACREVRLIDLRSLSFLSSQLLIFTDVSDTR